MPVADSRLIKCYDVYDYFLAHKDQLLSVDFLCEFVRPHCVFKRLHMRGSRLRIIQLPLEFAQFLVFMAERNITSYLEIGISTGGSWFMADSYLRAVCPGYQKSIGYDRTFKLRDYEAYRSRFPTCEFRHCHSQDMELNEPVDMSFIDATHKEQWVRHDFGKVNKMSQYVGFHDIVLRGATVQPFWKAVKNEYESWEFIDTSLPETCGIGVLKMPGN